MHDFWDDFSQFAKEKYGVDIVCKNTGTMSFNDLFPDITAYISAEEAAGNFTLSPMQQETTYDKALLSSFSEIQEYDTNIQGKLKKKNPMISSCEDELSAMLFNHFTYNQFWNKRDSSTDCVA